jgi:hypothetical protein
VESHHRLQNKGRFILFTGYCGYGFLRLVSPDCVNRCFKQIGLFLGLTK